MSDHQKLSEMKTEVIGNVFIIEKVVDAPRSLVFDVYTNADHLSKWWGPQGWETTVVKLDLEPSGIWHYGMTCVDESQGEFYGQESWGIGVYDRIEEPEILEYTDSFSDKEGTINDQLPSVKIKMTLKEDQGMTTLTLINEFASEEALQQVLEMGLKEGISSQFVRLDEYVKSIQA